MDVPASWRSQRQSYKYYNQYPATNRVSNFQNSILKHCLQVCIPPNMQVISTPVPVHISHTFCRGCKVNSLLKGIMFTMPNLICQQISFQECMIFSRWWYFMHFIVCWFNGFPYYQVLF